MSSHQRSHSAIVYKLKWFGRSNLTLLPEVFLVSNWRWNVPWNPAELWLTKTRTFFHMINSKQTAQGEFYEWTRDEFIGTGRLLEMTGPQNSVAVTDVAFTTQHIGKDVRASSPLTRRAVDLISEACFTGDLRASHVSAVARSQSLWHRHD